MADFPLLNSGAKAQYPLRQTIKFETHVMKFVDGGEQRFRQHRGAEKEWELQLSALGSDEARRLSAFVDEQAGRQGEFPFQDPQSGVVAASHLTDDSLQVMQTDDEKHVLQVSVKSKV
ncbi:MAG: DUF2460 domain-containing protein [Acidobacteria bacterium]|nr:DUF2460 domain-containing protein [Acidobacteriota bacterium]